LRFIPLKRVIVIVNTFFAANTLVQKLLPLIIPDLTNLRREAQKKFIHPLTKVLGLLVNPSVTELDCYELLDCKLDIYQELNSFLVEHALNNCPDIRKITLMAWEQHEQKHILPVCRLKKSWNNLKSINVGYLSLTCNEDTLKLIQENFPNIESVFRLNCSRRQNYFLLFFNPQGVKHKGGSAHTGWSRPFDKYEETPHFGISMQFPRTQPKFNHHRGWGSSKPMEV
jgi:hypothetical protein